MEEFLAAGMSLDAIGKEVGKHPSTVSYWLKKHGLMTAGGGRYAKRPPLRREQLQPLVDSGATLAEMAAQLDRSVSTVRYWLARHEIDLPNPPGPRKRSCNGAKIARFECRRHGMTEFKLEGRGNYRCKRCRSAAVVDRRRKVKRKLVEEAGGACVLCGYRRWNGALQFHHVDPAHKQFQLSQRGHSRALARSRAEIRKCVLLCANCHAEVEGGFATLPASEGLSG